MPTDLTHAAAAISAGRACARDLLEAAIDATPALGATFIRRFDATARATADAVDAGRKVGAPLPPLAGLALSVKDLFDVAGQPTTAASRSLADAAPAMQDAPAVSRLRAAGAALVGHTNLTEFAYSGVGLNPHHGTPPNVATVALDGQARIPGGSTSGGASSVAGGAAWAALGSDTGGSIRIPAALQGLVGFKSTARLVPTNGCIPLSTTLDTACAITRSVRDAVRLHEVLAARQVPLATRAPAGWRLAVPRRVMLDALEPAVATAFCASLSTLRAAGLQIDEVDLPLLDEAASLHRGGGLSAAESWAWHRERLARREAQYDPRVALRIRRGASIGAADYIDLLRERTAWITRMEAALAPWDALLSPTVPIVAPRVASLQGDDEAFFAVNAQLLRNPSIVNLLDGCALSLPCHPVGDWPVGLMVWSTALADDRVLAVSLALEAALAPVTGRG
jgi:amidase/aspartyl-tRNA(Asn)/glutamyl-tRNA(Gln) amidotransferase subunit A